MFGVILISVGQLFNEISDSIAKDRGQRQESLLHVLGFLQLVWGFTFFAALAFIRSDLFVFSAASLPTFLTRAFLEILQFHVTLLAIFRADRSTFGFVRVGTVPLLLLVDFVLAYAIKSTQVVGVGLIILSFLVIFAGRQIGRRGIALVIFTALNAVITLSLLKYDITHFNSLTAEQLLISLIVLLYFLLSSIFVKKINPFSYFRERVFLAQSITAGLGFVLESFAYVFAPASIILAAKRGSVVLWSTLSGNIYFGERKLFLKLFVAVLLISGIVLLAF